MMTMIVDTLPVFYYKKMVDYTPLSFADLVPGETERDEMRAMSSVVGWDYKFFGGELYALFRMSC